MREQPLSALVAVLFLIAAAPVFADETDLRPGCPPTGYGAAACVPPMGLEQERVVHYGRDLGLTGKVVYADDVLSFGFSDVANRDLLDGPRIVPFPGPADSLNYRRQATFRYAPKKTDSFRFELAGGTYLARRPAAGRYPRLQLGPPSAWVEHQSEEFGLSIGLLDERIRYEGGFARSNYEGKLDYQAPQRRPDRWTLPLRGGSGEAYSHRLEADLFTSGSTRLMVYGGTQSASPRFRRGVRADGLRRYSTGKIDELGMRFNAGRSSVDMTYSERNARDRDQRRLEGELSYGSIAVGVFSETFQLSRGVTQLMTEDAYGGSLTYDLSTLTASAGGSAAALLLPASVSVGLRRGEIRYPGPSEAQPDIADSFNVGVSWIQPNGGTDLSFYRGRTEAPANSQLGADVREFGFDLTQTAQVGAWAATGYVSVGEYKTDYLGDLTSDQWAVGGVSLGYSRRDFPDLSFGIDADGYRGAYPAYGARFREATASFDVGVDFSKFFPVGGAMRIDYFAVSGGGAPEGGFEHVLGGVLGFQF